MGATSGSIQAGKGHVTLSTDSTPLQTGLKAAAKDVKDWGNNILSFSKYLVAAGGAIAAPFIGGALSFAEFGDEVSKTARITGMSFGEVQQAMAGTRMSADDLQGATSKMNSFMSHAMSGGADATEALREMGISVQDLAGASQFDRMRMLADGLNRIGDAGQRAALQKEIFGKGSIAANFTGGAAGMDARAQRQFQLAPMMSDEDVKSSTALSRSMKDLGLVTASVWRQIGSVAAPILTEWNQWITKIISQVQDWVMESRELLKGIFSVGFTVLKVGIAVGAVGAAVLIVAKVFGFLAATVGVIGAVVGAVLSPVGLVILGIAAAVGLTIAQWYVWTSIFPEIGEIAGTVFGAIKDYLSAWTPILDSFKATFMKVWGGISDAIAGGEFGLAFQIAVTGIKLVWAQVVNWLRDAWFSTTYIIGNVWDTVTTAMAHAWVDFADTIKGIFAGVSNFIENTFWTVVGAIVAAINAVIRAVPERIAAEVGLTTIANPNNQAAQDARAERQNLDAANRDRLTRLAHQEIDRDAGLGERARAAARAAERARARGEEAGLQAELDDQAWQAEGARAIAEHQRWIDGDSGDGPEGDWKKAKGSVQGSFSAQAIMGMLGSSGSESPAARQARLTQRQIEQNEDQIRLLQRIADQVGVRFS